GDRSRPDRDRPAPTQSRRQAAAGQQRATYPPGRSLRGAGGQGLTRRGARAAPVVVAGWHAGPMAIQIAQDPTADSLLEESDFALLVGMMLDQQYPMEHAFRGPAKIRERLGTFTVDGVAEADPD